MTYTYRYISSARFLTNYGSVSIICSPAPSSSLRQGGTSDLSLKKVQVATRLDFCERLYGYCLIVCVTPTALPLVIDCKLARIYSE